MDDTDKLIEEALELLGGEFPEEVRKDVGDLARNVYSKNMLMKDAMGLDDKIVEGLYGFAYRLYSMGKYNEALQMFRLLIMLNPVQAKYTLGLAACFHMKKEYLSAASTYGLVSIIDPDDPLPYYHASDCHMEIGNYDLALSSLNTCLEKIGNKKEFKQLKDRAEVTIDSVKQKMQEHVERKKRK